MKGAPRGRYCHGRKWKSTLRKVSRAVQRCHEDVPGSERQHDLDRLWPPCRPREEDPLAASSGLGASTFAMFVGYLTGLRGEILLNSIFAHLVAARLLNCWPI